MNNSKIKKIIIGSAQFGMDYGIANKKGKILKNGITSILDLAIKNGIDSVDTAKSYGESEKNLGEYFREKPCNSWKVITKINKIKENVLSQLIDSKKKLNYTPNTILAHSAQVYLNPKYQKELIDSKDEVGFKKIGVSIYNIKELDDILNSDLKPDIIQIPINILDTRFYDNALGHLYNMDIEIHARSIFLQGLFYLSDNQIKMRFKDVFPVIQKLKDIAGKSNLTIAQLSLLWLSGLKEIKKIIIGLDTAEHLSYHIKTLNMDVGLGIFEEALAINYTNEKVLNPSFW